MRPFKTHIPHTWLWNWNFVYEQNACTLQDTERSREEIMSYQIKCWLWCDTYRSLFWDKICNWPNFKNVVLDSFLNRYGHFFQPIGYYVVTTLSNSKRVFLLFLLNCTDPTSHIKPSKYDSNSGTKIFVKQSWGRGCGSGQTLTFLIN